MTALSFFIIYCAVYQCRWREMSLIWYIKFMTGYLNDNFRWHVQFSTNIDTCSYRTRIYKFKYDVINTRIYRRKISKDLCRAWVYIQKELFEDSTWVYILRRCISLQNSISWSICLIMINNKYVESSLLTNKCYDHYYSI